MDYFKFRRLQSFLLLFILVVLVPSCDKDEEETPDYLGTWISIRSIEGYGVFTQFKDVLTITEDEFSDLGQMFNSTTNEWIDYQLVKASITVTDDFVNSTVIELGFPSFDSSGFPTGELISYTESYEQFDQLIEQVGLSKIWVSEFHVSGNELVLYRDHNDDGDYLDENETMIFMKN